MNFNIFKRNKHKEERALTYYSDALNFNNYSSFSANYAMRLSAVYRAVELISDSVAMLPIYVQFEDSDGFKIANKCFRPINIAGVFLKIRLPAALSLRPL